MNKPLDLNRKIQQLTSDRAFLRTQRDSLLEQRAERDRQIAKLNRVVSYLRRSWWNRLRLQVHAWRRK